MSEQNFANHAKYVPAFHFFVLPVLFLNLGWSIHRWAVVAMVCRWRDLGADLRGAW